MAEIPLAPIERIMKKAGAARVSEDAKEAVREAIEKHAKELTSKAIALSKHAGRKTVRSEDIKLQI